MRTAMHHSLNRHVIESVLIAASINQALHADVAVTRSLLLGKNQH